MRKPNRFVHLSPAFQVLVRLCQITDNGQITHLYVENHEPKFSPEPIVLADYKLDRDDEGPRPERELTDFELRSEVLRLIRQVQTIARGKVWIEVRAGLPRKLTVESKASETVR